MERIIGEHIGKERGPLVICIAAIHGNEPAGVKALDLALKMLEVEPITNPEFVFRGKLVGILGNLHAIQQGKRFIHKDLNRNFIKERMDKIFNHEMNIQHAEDREAVEVINAVLDEIEKYDAEKLIIIDLHTTSSPGGIFAVVPDDPDCIQIAQEMHAPVIKGLMEGIQGTILHYFNEKNIGIPTHSITFESGQHDDPLAVNIAIAGIIAGLRAVGCVEAMDVESLHDDLLLNFSRDLPQITELIMKHSIIEGDQFKMKPNYLNFQEVKKGEVIAKDKYGDISIAEDGILLMPLYQDQGEDGFFLIRKIESYEFHK